MELLGRTITKADLDENILGHMQYEWVSNSNCDESMEIKLVQLVLGPDNCIMDNQGYNFDYLVNRKPRDKQLMLRIAQDVHLVVFYIDGSKDVLVYRYHEESLTYDWMGGHVQWCNAWERHTSLIEANERLEAEEKKVTELNEIYADKNYLAPLNEDSWSFEKYSLAMAASDGDFSWWPKMRVDAIRYETIKGQSGVYAFLDGEDQPLYVGKSETLGKRLKSHEKLKKAIELGCETVAFIPFENYVVEMERILILKLQPLMNEKYERPAVNPFDLVK